MSAGASVVFLNFQILSTGINVFCLHEVRCFFHANLCKQIWGLKKCPIGTNE